MALIIRPQRIVHAILAARLVLNVRWYAERTKGSHADFNVGELDLGPEQIRKASTSELHIQGFL